MKVVNLIWVLVFIISGCSKNENDPIMLCYSIFNDKPNPVIGNQVKIEYPALEKTQLVIIGGDGSFTISNSDATKLKVDINDRLIDLTPLSTGEITLTINDQSKNSYILNVSISYIERQFSIDKQDVVVVGDKLSTEQKKQIELEATATIPIEVNGGYRFVYNNSEDRNKGQVFIYKNSFSDKAIESTFEIKYNQKEGYSYRSYIISIDGKQREFILNKYITTTKSDMVVPIAFIEILTEQFKTEYPNIECVYTQQRIKN